MAMRSFGLVLAMATLSCSAAIAAPMQERLRGTIASVSAGEILVHTRGGRDVPVLLNGGTSYLQVTKASLGHIATGSYIGTATKSIGSTLVALEVVVFPPSMRGTGEGHYAWDKIADTTLAGNSTTASTMTNGNVAAVSAPAATMVNSSMTNGNVSASASQNGVRQLTVTYKGGQQMIIVPPTAPIVTFRPGTVSEVTKGAPVFIKAVKNGNSVTAEAVAVGIDGVTPPM